MSTPLSELPPDWEWATVGAIGRVSGGLTQNSKRKEHRLKLPFLRVANVYANELRLDEVEQIGLSEKEKDRVLLARNDLLVVEGNGSIGQIGRVALWDGSIDQCAHQNHLIKVRFGSAVIPAFVLYWMLSPSGRAFIVKQASSTSGLHTLSLTKVSDLPVPLSPFAAQTRIVEAIESYFTRLDNSVATLERVQANLKRYRASVLKAAVEGRLVPTEAELARQEGRDYEPASVLLERILKERRRRWEEAELAAMKAKGKAPKDDTWKAKYKEPVAPDTSELPELPDGWCWASLEALTSAVRVICYGILMPKAHIDDGVPYVKVRDMKGDRLNVASLTRTSPEIAAQYARASLKAGDLLLAIRGTYGRVVEVPPELEGGNITQDTARLDLHPILDRTYIAAFLRSPDAQNYFKRVARGVAVKGVNIGDVRPTPIALPPSAEQARIVEFVERHVSVAATSEDYIASERKRANRLRQSILKWAFEGKLADQDPNDEPASVLLERIKAERKQAGGSRRTKKPAVRRVA